MLLRRSEERVFCAESQSVAIPIGAVCAPLAELISLLREGQNETPLLRVRDKLLKCLALPVVQSARKDFPFEKPCSNPVLLAIV